jgi:hypothetical protein
MSVLQELRPVSTPAISAETALNKLEALDMSMIRSKLADPVEGKGWSTDDLDLAEGEYRRFLALQLMYPGEDIVPCGLVDDMWHAHILDTRAYVVDCEAIFGAFLHHFPYFGLRGPEDAADLEQAYDSTLDRYRAAFGEPTIGVWQSDDNMKCRTECKPQKCR